MLNRVILASCRRDIEINRLSVPAILECVDAKRYLLVVPAADVPAFRKELPSGVEVLDERSVLPDCDIARIAGSLGSEFASRAGWYLQQFLKIELASGSAQQETALIWDADSVPLRPLAFEDSMGRIGLYTGVEFHRPYFDTIERILGLGRTVSGSFIAQCMCVRPTWISGMKDTIEFRCGRSWIDAILENLAQQHQSAFSEYETIGTYVTNAHSNEVFLNDRPWFRWGGGYFGDIRNVTASGLKQLSRYYDFVAFERWDRGFKSWCRSRIQIAKTRAEMLRTAAH